MRELEFREAMNLCGTHSKLPWEPKPGLAYSRGIEPQRLLAEEPRRQAQTWELEVLSVSGMDKMFEEHKVTLLRGSGETLLLPQRNLPTMMQGWMEN